MYWFVWSFFSRVEVCRHEDRFVALLRSFYRPAYCVEGEGVFPFCLADFYPWIYDRCGVGVCGMVYLMADY